MFCDGALDAGNFLAHLDLGVEEADGTDPGDAQRFLAAYAPADHAHFEVRLEAYRRATRLRLACLHGFNPSRAPAALALLRW